VDKQGNIDHWLNSSDLDFETMEYLYQGKRYSWALFIGHLVIEKLLKALFVKSNPDNTPVPKIHNLLTISQRAFLTLSKEQEDKLDTITTFNMRARYQNEKLDFYKRCTKEYSDKQIKNIKELRQWLKTLV
jgi:HEPN domain-containing protein